jgi:predicted metal-dependent peptidase
MSNFAKAEDMLMRAKVQVQLDHAFFAFLLLKHKITLTTDIDTLDVDGFRNICANPDFIVQFGVPEIVWALCHEVMHPMLGHHVRRGSREPDKWNYAGDAVINDLLRDCGVGTPIPNTVDMRDARHKTTEQIYADLPDNPPPRRGTGTGNEWCNGLGDDINNDKPLTPDEIKDIEIQAKIELGQAALAAKARGQLTGKLAEFVAGIVGVDTKWYDILTQFMQSMANAETTWKRPNRRYQDVYLPSVAKVPNMGTVVLQVDVSGSISKAEAQHYGGHMTAIVEQCKPERVIILYTDSDVKRVDTFEFGEDIEFHFFSAGGTDMTAGFDWCDANDVQPDVFVCLTDGHTPFGVEQSYPVVWVITSDVKPAHGMHVPFKIEG